MLAKDSEFVEYLVALLIVDLRVKRRLDSWVGMRGWRLETNAADVEIFLEAIELQEVGEFQSADISALCTDFLLKRLGAMIQTQLAAAGAAIVDFQRKKEASWHEVQARLGGAGPGGASFGYMGEQGLDIPESAKSHGRSFGYMGEGGSAMDVPAETGTFAPKGGGGDGRHKGGGGGGADPMAGMDDALVSSQGEMDKLNKEFEKLGSEAQMASKGSVESFNTIRDRARDAYKEMDTAYKSWAEAVKSGGC